MMVITLLLALLTFPTSPPFHSATVQSTRSWRIYKGAWFEIKYPANFRVRPSQPSITGPGYESVFFAAPDGSVEFYVFSPQWNGTPADIEMDPGSEILVSQKVEQRSGTTIRRVALRSRDGAYQRAFEDTEDATTNTRKVFGIKYRDQASYSRYRQAYLAFKASLMQFAD